MKNFFKYVLVVIVCLACMFTYTLFMEPSIVSITKSSSNGVYDTYIIKYSNGKTDSFVIKNGENGNDISIQELYIATKTAKGLGDEYTLLDFINEYLSFSVEEKDETKAYLGALSTVEVYCEFPTSLDISTFKKGYGLSMGAGVIYQPEGVTDEYYIVTNYHQVYNRESISTNNIATKFMCFLYGANVEIQTQSLSFGGYSISYGEDAFECEYVGGSMKNDIAVLKVKTPEVISSSNARPIKVCTKDPVVGETVVAIGNPEGLGTSVTKGIVSVDSEYMTMLASDNRTQITFRAMRIDAAVNSGNSGGGLYNTDGELLGIVNSKLQDEAIEGMAFALPGVTSIKIAQNIIDNSSATNKQPIKAFLGLKTKVSSSRAEYVAETKSIKIVEKIKIEGFEADSICKDQLLLNDIIESVQIDGTLYQIDREFRLEDLTWLMKENSVIIINVIHEGSTTVSAESVVVNSDCFKTVV